MRFSSVPVSIALTAFMTMGCVYLPSLAPEDRTPIVAIDVALEPDRSAPDPPTAIRPHITLVRGFVRSANVHAVTASVAMIMATTDLERLNVKTSGGSGSPMTIDPTPELRRLQERMAEAFTAFAVDPVEAHPFIVTPDGASISDSTIHRVAYFVQESSGVNYRPQLVAGAGQPPSGAFKPMGAAVYLLDHAGNAHRSVWTWNGESGSK